MPIESVSDMATVLNDQNESFGTISTSLVTASAKQPIDGIWAPEGDMRMTQIEKTIVRLYQHGYVVATIARALGEDRSYVEYVLDSYFGWPRPERWSHAPAVPVGPGD